MTETHAPDAVLACTIATDLEAFPQLIEEMELRFGPQWGGLDFADAQAVLASAEAQNLELVVIALDVNDADRVNEVTHIVKSARQLGFQTVLVAKDLTPAALHGFMRLGADDFLPYPLPAGSLKETQDQFQAQRTQMGAAAQAAPAHDTGPIRATGKERQGKIISVFGLSGGVGSSTLCSNLAWELQTAVASEGLRVIAVDLDLQFGNIATYLDVPRSDASFDFLSNLETADDENLNSAVSVFEQRLDVLAAPHTTIASEELTEYNMGSLIDLLKRNYDYVVIDMPHVILPWVVTVLNSSDAAYGLLGLDMRSAQNALRFARDIAQKDGDINKMQWILNRTPKLRDLNGRQRVKKLADSLDIEFAFRLPDGGTQVPFSCDHGSPLANMAPKNVLRREIQKMAAELSKPEE